MGFLPQFFRKQKKWAYLLAHFYSELNTFKGVIISKRDSLSRPIVLLI